jgi:hypothetical protein
MILSILLSIILLCGVVAVYGVGQLSAQIANAQSLWVKSVCAGSIILMTIFFAAALYLGTEASFEALKTNDDIQKLLKNF